MNDDPIQMAYLIGQLEQKLAIVKLLIGKSYVGASEMVLMRALLEIPSGVMPDHDFDEVPPAPASNAAPGLSRS